MARRHISPREAHRLRREVERLRRYAIDTTTPILGDRDCRGVVLTVTLSEYGRGMVNGTRLMPRCALIARRTDDNVLTVYAYQMPEEKPHA